MPIKPTRMCRKCLYDKPKKQFKGESRVCNTCRIPTGKRNHEWARKQRMTLWGEICEYFVCTPNVSVKDVADHFGMNYVHVSSIIKRYFGNGTPVVVQFQPDE